MAFYKVCGNYYGTDNDANSLKHYRTPGSKNGVRKYQYEDGTLTPAGKIHYGVGKSPKGGPAGVQQTKFNDKTNYFTKENDYGYGKHWDPVSSDIRFNSGRAQRRILNNDARPTGINKAVYDATIWGRQAASDVNKAVDDAKNWVGDRASDVKNWGEQAGRDVGKAVDDAKNWVGDRASDAKNLGEQAVGNVKKAGDKVGDFLNANNVNRMADDAKNWVGERASDAKNWGEQAVGNVKKAGDNAGDWVRDRASDVKNWGEQAVGNAKKAGDNVGNWVGDRASDVKKAGDKVGDWVGAKAKDVSSWGSGAVNKGRDFITGLFGNKKKQSAPEPKKSNAIDLKKIAGKNVSKPKK